MDLLTSEQASHLASVVSKQAEDAVHQKLVAMIEQGELPDIGFMKLKEMARSFSDAFVPVGYDAFCYLNHPDKCPIGLKLKIEKQTTL